MVIGVWWMVKVKDHKDLHVWQRAMQLVFDQL